MASRTQQRTIKVFADWETLSTTQLMGELNSVEVKGREVFSFEYNADWLKEGNAQSLDPDLQFFSGPQYLNDEKTNFGIFLDSSPDRWGRLLMRKREAALAKKEGRKVQRLSETDYLLGVYDEHRMGALRFKEDENGPFLNDNREFATPPWTSLRELEHASLQLEKDNATDDPDYLKWLAMLVAPGSSLGGARPKASVTDAKGELWIAKFPSQSDDRDTGGWEMVVHELAVRAGLHMPEVRVERFNSKNHTFLSKRFDRTAEGKRIHFASAMTMLGYTDGTNHEDGASYLELAEFLVRNGENPDLQLKELWRRIVFNICVTNTDDHLRNHGFLLGPNGWRLSPAYDINPIETGNGLKLNISENDNSINLELAMDVSAYFRVEEKEAAKIIADVKNAVKDWRKVAERLKIPKVQYDLVVPAFFQE